MKYSVAVTAIVLMCVGGGAAVAACGDSGYTTQLISAGENNIQGALNDKRILATGGSEEWNEDHCSNGNLFKVGVADDPDDPRAYRGTWDVSGNGANSVVIYNYTIGDSSTFSWKLWQSGSGGLCWEDPSSGNIIATAPPPGPLSGTCNTP